YGPGGNLSADAVTHVNFFSQPETVDFLLRALAGDQQPLRRIDPQAPLPTRKIGRGTAPAPLQTPQRPTLAPQPTASAVMSAGAPPPAAPPPLQVTVVNGDLMFEKNPLLLGHYRSTRLTGTEYVVNDLVGGAMKRALDVGLYPSTSRSSEIYLNMQPFPEDPDGLPRPKAVIVVGLGEEGNLQAQDLAVSVRRAVISWAQRTTELDASKARGARPVPAALRSIELAATLLGSGGKGITAGESAQRVVQGVYEANE